MVVKHSKFWNKWAKCKYSVKQYKGCCTKLLSMNLDVSTLFTPFFFLIFFLFFLGFYSYLTLIILSSIHLSLHNQNQFSLSSLHSCLSESTLPPPPLPLQFPNPTPVTTVYSLIQCHRKSALKGPFEFGKSFFSEQKGLDVKLFWAWSTWRKVFHVPYSGQ